MDKMTSGVWTTFDSDKHAGLECWLPGCSKGTLRVLRAMCTNIMSVPLNCSALEMVCVSNCQALTPEDYRPASSMGLVRVLDVSQWHACSHA